MPSYLTYYKKISHPASLTTFPGIRPEMRFFRVTNEVNHYSRFIISSGYARFKVFGSEWKMRVSWPSAKKKPELIPAPAFS